MVPLFEGFHREVSILSLGSCGGSPSDIFKRDKLAPKAGRHRGPCVVAWQHSAS